MSVFISYSHVDSDFTQKIAFELVRSKAHIWMDVNELRAGDSLIDKIQAALDTAGAIVVILSKAFVASSWCQTELSAGLIRELEEKNIIVIPVLKEDCTVPIFLRRKMYADFRTDFSRGMGELLGALASETSEALGRFEHGEYHTDWSIDWFFDTGLFRLRITLIDHYKNQPYSVLTELLVKLNDEATAHHRMYDDAGLGWFGRHVLVERLAELRGSKDLFLLLHDQFPKRLRVKLADTGGTSRQIEVEISARRVGDDNGKDVLVNVASQLGMLCDAQRAQLRKTTHEEERKILAIIRGIVPSR